MNIKKFISLLIMTVTVLTLTACGEEINSDLQANKWSVVASNGEGYTASFNKDTVSFDLGIVARGFYYEIKNESEIHLEKDGEEAIVFDVEKKGDDYFFKATNESVKKQYGDLTLTPITE